MEKEEFKQKKDTTLAIIGILFFVMLAFIARGTKKESLEKDQVTSPSPSATSPSSSDEEENNQNSIFNKIEAGNYHFIYTITINDQIKIMEGKASHQKWKFSIIGDTKEEYAKISDHYLKLQNGNYSILKDSIDFFFPYIEISHLLDTLELSTFKEEDGKIIYDIDPVDLLDQYSPDLDYDSFENFKEDCVVLYLNEENMVEKIEIDYSHYFTYVNDKDTVFKVTMEFDHFGTIEELDI